MLRHLSVGQRVAIATDKMEDRRGCVLRWMKYIIWMKLDKMIKMIKIKWMKLLYEWSYVLFGGCAIWRSISWAEVGGRTFALTGWFNHWWVANFYTVCRAEMAVLCILSYLFLLLSCCCFSFDMSSWTLPIWWRYWYDNICHQIGTVCVMIALFSCNFVVKGAVVPSLTWYWLHKIF